MTRGAPAALCRGGEGEGWLDLKRDDVSVVLTVRGKGGGNTPSLKMDERQW
jgi:hypothetical protein